MKFLRTASTGRLMGIIGGAAAVIAVCAAVAVAATSGGPVPKRQSLARAVHQALLAPAVKAITARVSFTNNLINTSELQGQGADPLLQGGTGRLWMSSAAHELRLEVQGQNGDAQVLVHNRSFWMYDPSSRTVYEGTLPTQTGSKSHKSAGHEAVPSVAQIQSGISHLMHHALVSGAIPGDIAGQAAYTVRVSPRQGGGLLRGLEVAWDAVRGVPLRFEVLARGDTAPVLELTATNVSYGSVPASAFAISPPAGAKVVRLTGSSSSAHRGTRSQAHKQRSVTGVNAVAKALPFKLSAPASLAGMPRSTVALVHFGSRPAALVTYGKGLGGVAVLEQSAGGRSTSMGGSSGGAGLSIPSVSVNGSSGQEIDTALGTVIRFTRDHVAYTVLGSVRPAVARAAARGL
jgi:outer membrane lipoprotein-sorting protein